MSADPRSRLPALLEWSSGRRAPGGLELKAHPHMLCHVCGYALANKGHDTRAIQGWLGHRAISTAVYMALAPNRFKGFLAGLMQSVGRILINLGRFVPFTSLR